MHTWDTIDTMQTKLRWGVNLLCTLVTVRKGYNKLHIQIILSKLVCREATLKQLLAAEHTATYPPSTSVLRLGRDSGFLACILA